MSIPPRPCSTPDHPPQKGRLEGLNVAICGDVLHSRVARSNIHPAEQPGRPRPPGRPLRCCRAEDRPVGVEVFPDMVKGLMDVES